MCGAAAGAAGADTNGGALAGPGSGGGLGAITGCGAEIRGGIGGVETGDFVTGGATGVCTKGAREITGGGVATGAGGGAAGFTGGIDGEWEGAGAGVWAAGAGRGAGGVAGSRAIGGAET